MKYELSYFDDKLIVEVNKFAKQANGSCLVRYGDTVVLSTATANKTAGEDIGFFPLQCVYQFKSYAHSKIPGGFFKRETKPSDRDVLSSRLLDRPIRPMFEEWFLNETQVICTILSLDEKKIPEPLALFGASTSLILSDMPFHTPLAGVTMGYVDNKIVVNPSVEEQENSKLNLFMVCTKEAIIMVEAGVHELSEEIVLEALNVGFQAVQPLIDFQLEMQKKEGKVKMQGETKKIPEGLENIVINTAQSGIEEAFKIKEKIPRSKKIDVVKSEATEKLLAEDADRNEKDIHNIIKEMQYNIMRKSIIENNVRVDGRDNKQIRPITCELSILPRVHGTAVFTRGETQSLVTVTLGTKDDEQMIDDSSGNYFKKFFLHYNFPPFSVGEAKRLGPPGRREVGHGKLAERGLLPLMPDNKDFPYTIRVSSEILESNGSSSMATVCGASLALMDAGVPITEPVAGIAMGLVIDKDKYSILSDILGDEDHIGDMDFKVVGTKNGITALQMDIKVAGISQEIMKEALAQAKEGRMHILSCMNEVISSPKKDISPYAPRFLQHKIPTNKIKIIIGAGGQTIRAITTETSTKIDISDTGLISISANNYKNVEAALVIIKDLLKEIEIGKIYDGTIKKVTHFGLFVECMPGNEGLVHISNLPQPTRNIESDYSAGQPLRVKATEIDNKGRLKLTAKEL